MNNSSYRSRIWLTGFAAAVATAGFQFPAAAAAAPFQAVQAPGYYHMALGKFEVTALLDGNGSLPAEILRGDKTDVQALLGKDFAATDHVHATVTTFLVNTGDKLILVDTGSGGKWGGPTLGKMLGNLKAAGYRPEQVDMVLLTHLHADHVSGITDAKGRRVFPNADIRMTQADSDHWLSKANADAAPEGFREFYSLAREAAAPYVNAKKWRPFIGTDEVAPGVKPYPIVGHTAGHTGYQFTSMGKTLLIWGDVVHVMPVQLPRPDISIVFDSDNPAAVSARQTLFDKLADADITVAGQHMPFPSIGHVRKDGAAFTWVPVTYSNDLSSLAKK